MEFYENITGEEGNGKRPHKIHFPRKNSALSLVSATLEIEYAMEFYENITGEEGNGKRPHKIHFPRKS